MTENSDGSLTKKEILQANGEFDSESIRFLKLDHQQIVTVDALAEFTNLVHLNLSDNMISALHVFRHLKSLVFLNLSSNAITNIDPLGYLEVLEELNLAGNHLSSTGRLKCLSSVSTLKKLRLEDKIHDLTNPLCQESGYNFTVVDMLSQLLVLDGERVKGRGSDLYQMCKDLDKQIENFEHDQKCPCDSCLREKSAGRTYGPVPERPLPEPWFKANFLKFEEKEERMRRSEAELEKVLRDCKKLDESVSSKIELLKQR